MVNGEGTLRLTGSSAIFRTMRCLLLLLCFIGAPGVLGAEPAAPEQTPRVSSRELELLVDAGELWPRLSADILSARERVFVQAMSFEGDSAGRGLSRALLQSSARDRRILVDSYTRMALSDRFVISPRFWLNRNLRAERTETAHMFTRLEDSGVQVRFTNPLRLNPLSFITRNHKKMVVIDSTVCYLGGINFSDHNFTWHDLMIRAENPVLAQALATDFELTWSGRERDLRTDCGGFEAILLDGRDNERDYETLLSLIDAARVSIWIESPYLTFPFYDALRRAHDRGVEVTLVTPKENNKGILDSYTIWETCRSGFELRHLEGMTHVKAILIDGSVLVVGSSNLDFVSYRLEPEVLLVLKEPNLLAIFAERIVEADTRRSILYRGGGRAVWGSLASCELHVCDALIRVLR